MARAKRNKSGGVYLRKGSPYWQYRHPVTGLRGSTGTTEKEAAEALLAKFKLDAFNSQFGRKPSITLNNLFTRFMIEHSQHLKSAVKVERYFSNLLKHLGNPALENINASELSIYKAKRRAENTKLSNSTINRELEYLRSSLNTAKSWGYNVPEITFKDVMLREPEARIKYLVPEQAQQLLDACSPLIRDAVEFALYTGLRAGNIFGLKWENINIFSKEIIVQIKSNIPGGKTLRLPISDKMMEILKRQTPEAKGIVFKNTQGNRVINYDRAFQDAKDKLDWKDFRFHDLRHTAATWLRMSGTPLEVVQEILGHTNITTTRKYAKVAKVEISNAMDKLNDFAQFSHNGIKH